MCCRFNLQKKLRMVMNEKLIVYVDLDNTLADFQSGVRTFPEEVRAQYGVDANGKDHTDEIPGLFARMGEMPGAKEAFAWLAAHFDVYILSTAPWNNPSAWSDKLLWVKEHLGEAAHKRLILSHRKDLLKGDYLIDDGDRADILNFEGRHIRIGTEPFKDWAAVIAYFKQNVVGD